MFDINKRLLKSILILLYSKIPLFELESNKAHTTANISKSTQSRRVVDVWKSNWTHRGEYVWFDEKSNPAHTLLESSEANWAEHV